MEFIENLKSIVITLVTILIFISAVELLSPNNKTNRYIQFILGLILIAVILNPILQLCINGEESVAKSIENYEELFKNNDVDSNKKSNNLFQNKEREREKVFIENLNRNCNDLLQNQYKDMFFKSEIDCTVDFSNMDVIINKIKIGVSKNAITKVNKIAINNSTQKSSNSELTEYASIIKLISNEFKVSKEKIEIYDLAK